MLNQLKVKRIESSRQHEVDYQQLTFGADYSDHMFVMEFHGGNWQAPRIEPYGPIRLDPGAASLHYGQTVFEGLKAFHGVDGLIRVFRPDQNARRLSNSCDRLCLPKIDEELFCEAIDELVRIDRRWIPKVRGQALYIRPLLFATEPHLDVRPSEDLMFIIMTAPVREYFDRDGGTVSLEVSRQYTRAAPGGMGYAKTAGNYAASLKPNRDAQKAGHQQVLWLDGAEHRYVEEVGQMNIFFHFGDEIATPELRGTILPGVTRSSVIRLLQDQQFHVVERRIEIAEVVEAIESGRLQEAFGCGTAAVISPVGNLCHDGINYPIGGGSAGELGNRLYDQILDIQTGAAEDKYHWNRIVS